jgi:hypothetical protein
MVDTRRRPVTFTQAPDGTVTLDPGDAPTWTQYLTDFDQAVSQVQATLSALQSQPPADPAASGVYNQLVSDGQAWLGKLRNLQSMRDSVASWLSGIVSEVSDPFVAIGLSGAPPAPRAQQLGIVPLIVAGVGLAAFAAVVYGALQWAQQAQRFSQLNRQAQAAIAGGADPQAAYAQAARTLNIAAPAGGGFLSGLGSNLLLWGAAAALLLWLGPKLLDRITHQARD